MKYYYINLDSAIERRVQIEKQFTDNNVEFQRVEAILYDENNKNTKLAREIACHKSHIKAIYEFVNNSNDEYAVICEDDLTFEYKKYWRYNNLEEVINMSPNDMGIIQLCIIYARINKPEVSWKLQPDFIKWGTIHGVGSCLSYIITRKCAIELLKYYCNGGSNINDIIISTTSDCSNGGVYINVNKFTDFTSYTYKYPMFTYRDNNDTQLGNCLNNQESSKRQVRYFLEHST